MAHHLDEPAGRPFTPLDTLSKSTLHEKVALLAGELATVAIQTP
jgi:hypothetical protein